MPFFCRESLVLIFSLIKKQVHLLFLQTIYFSFKLAISFETKETRLHFFVQKISHFKLMFYVRPLLKIHDFPKFFHFVFNLLFTQISVFVLRINHFFVFLL